MISVVASLTTISSKPNCAATCKLVLLLSSKSGFCKSVGFVLMIRLTSSTSLRRMARRKRIDGSIIVLRPRPAQTMMCPTP